MNWTCKNCGKSIPLEDALGRKTNGPIFRHVQRCPSDIKQLARMVGANIKNKNDCWLPTVSQGRAKVRGGVRAHIVAYELTYGQIPPRMVVCHSCDVIGCINPNHLWAGTQKENLRDMMTKGRGRGQIAKGNAGSNSITKRVLGPICRGG